MRIKQPAAFEPILRELIVRRRAPSWRARWRLRQSLRSFGKQDKAIVILTRDDLRAAIQDLLTGEADTEAIRGWAKAVVPLVHPFGVTGRPIEPEAGYHFSIYAVINNLASDPGQAFLEMDVEGLARMSASLDLDDPGNYEGDAYKEQLNKHLSMSLPTWAQQGMLPPNPPRP
jgi:hypothetical protein